MSVSKTRAIAVFGKDDSGGVAWPYGVYAHVRSSNWSDEEYAAHCKDREEAQQLVFDWAQKHGLKRTDKGCCPKWLQRPRNFRCSGNNPCTRYGMDTPDHSWLKHATTWTFNRQPAVITAAPYNIDQDDHDRLAWWMQEDPRLSVAFGGAGWYGLDMKQIVLWRTDLIDTIDPA